MKTLALTLLFLISTVSACSKDVTGSNGDNGKDILPVPDDLITYGNESLVALDPAGKEIAFEYSAPRDKKVGIFYFIWQGAHGYDQGGYANGDIIPPAASDTQSPYDINEMEKGYSNPQNIPFGPQGAMHYWGKPYLDYYVANDAWVIRKHAQMLTQAGIDVVFLDVTNGYAYVPIVTALCDIYCEMAREANKAPKISFLLNTNPGPVMAELQTVYANSKYKDLWFELDGKPLILAPLEDYGTEVARKFTIRYSWFDTQFGHGGNWWGNGRNKWSWGEFSPQRNVKEEMPVMAASHAHLNIGRSFSGPSPSNRGGTQPQNTTEEQRAAGTYFKQQFEHALTCDPDLIFLTGWNEWVAQRQIRTAAGGASSFLGQPIKNGDSYFVDCYNHEYSRDLEPCATGFKDTYYYYMVDYVRRYKGVSQVKPVKELHKVSIDGTFGDWNPLGTRYADFRFDTETRNHWGFGYKNISLKNSTGRNDFHIAKVATDAKMLYFYIETFKSITPSSDPNWMRLFISIKGSTAPAWEGFQWVVNNKVLSDTETTLQRSKGGWSWEDAATINYAVNGKQMEIAIPLSALGITNVRDFIVDFKWIDNSVTNGDICECMRDGDSAPDSRFRYRYIFNY